MNAIAIMYVNAAPRGPAVRGPSSVASRRRWPRSRAFGHVSPPPSPTFAGRSSPMRSARPSRSCRIGRIGSDLPLTRSSSSETRRPPLPPAEVFVCLRQVGGRVDVAEGDARRDRAIARPSRGSRRVARSLGQGAQPPFAPGVEVHGGGERRLAANDHGQRPGAAVVLEDDRIGTGRVERREHRLDDGDDEARRVATDREDDRVGRVREGPRAGRRAGPRTGSGRGRATARRAGSARNRARRRRGSGPRPGGRPRWRGRATGGHRSARRACRDRTGSTGRRRARWRSRRAGSSGGSRGRRVARSWRRCRPRPSVRADGRPGSGAGSRAGRGRPGWPSRTSGSSRSRRAAPPGSAVRDAPPRGPSPRCRGRSRRRRRGPARGRRSARSRSSSRTASGGQPAARAASASGGGVATASASFEAILRGGERGVRRRCASGPSPACATDGPVAHEPAVGDEPVEQGGPGRRGGGPVDGRAPAERRWRRRRAPPGGPSPGRWPRARRLGVVARPRCPARSRAVRVRRGQEHAVQVEPGRFDRRTRHRPRPRPRAGRRARRVWRRREIPRAGSGSRTTAPTIRSVPDGPAQHQPIAARDGDRRRETKDRDARPVGQVDARRGRSVRPSHRRPPSRGGPEPAPDRAGPRPAGRGSGRSRRRTGRRSGRGRGEGRPLRRRRG